MEAGRLVRDARMLLCDINIALEDHPPWYLDRAGTPHRLLFQSADTMRTLIACIEELEKENDHLQAEIDDLQDEICCEKD